MLWGTELGLDGFVNKPGDFLQGTDFEKQFGLQGSALDAWSLSSLVNVS